MFIVPWARSETYTNRCTHCGARNNNCYSILIIAIALGIDETKVFAFFRSFHRYCFHRIPTTDGLRVARVAHHAKLDDTEASTL